MIDYRLYTIADLRHWLLENADNGLSNVIISPSRAYALLKNPHAEDSDVVVSAAFAEGRVVGYTAQYAERLARPAFEEKYFWGTTEWVDPSMRGHGIGFQIMKRIKDACNQRYLASDSTEASIRLDEKQGWHIVYYPRYKYAIGGNQKGLRAKLRQLTVYHNNNKILRQLLSTYPYRNEYVKHIDDATYSFIESHSNGDVFLRRREMFDWLLQYPWRMPNHDDATTTDPCEFGLNCSRYEMNAVKVYADDRLVGFYIYSIDECCLQLRYIYCDNSYAPNVYTSVLNRALYENPYNFTTFHNGLHQFMQGHGIRGRMRKTAIDQIALTLPGNMDSPKGDLQGGDGDMLT